MKRLKKVEGDQLPIDELLPEVDAIGHKPVKKIQGDQLAIDELLPEVDAIAPHPVKKALDKQPLYKVKNKLSK